jgi:hypothetical protein
MFNYRFTLCITSQLEKNSEILRKDKENWQGSMKELFSSYTVLGNAHNYYLFRAYRWHLLYDGVTVYSRIFPS